MSFPVSGGAGQGALFPSGFRAADLRFRFVVTVPLPQNRIAARLFPET